MGAALAGFLALALQTGAGPAISLRPSAGVVEVTGLAPAELHRLAELEDFDQWSRVFSVEVNDSAGVPVLGRYEIEGGLLRFHPMFPFDPGREYRVRLILSGPPVEAVVSLPPLDREPTTRVSEIYPTADALPENQLKLYIHFTAPMSGGDGLPHVRLLEESGREVEEPFLPLGSELWDRGRRRYTIFFDPGRVKRGILPHEQMGRPLEAGKRYAIEIAPAWRDGRGVPLAAPFRKEFTAAQADETSIDPAEWKLSIPRARTREPLVVDFPEPLDRSLLARALGVEGVEGEAEISHREMRWSFTPDEPWATGRYELRALSILEDLAGNRIGRRFEVDRFDRIDERPEEEVHRLPFAIPE